MQYNHSACKVIMIACKLLIIIYDHMLDTCNYVDMRLTYDQMFYK